MCPLTTTPTLRHSTFTHLDATTELSRQVAALGIYPAVDPLASTSTILSPEVVGDHHYNVARHVQETLQRYKELQDIIAILGLDELSEEDRLTVTVPVKCSASCRNRSMSPRSSPVSRASTYLLLRLSNHSRLSSTVNSTTFLSRHS